MPRRCRSATPCRRSRTRTRRPCQGRDGSRAELGRRRRLGRLGGPGVAAGALGRAARRTLRTSSARAQDAGGAREGTVVLEPDCARPRPRRRGGARSRGAPCARAARSRRRSSRRPRRARRSGSPGTPTDGRAPAARGNSVPRCASPSAARTGARDRAARPARATGPSVSAGTATSGVMPPPP